MVLPSLPSIAIDHGSARKVDQRVLRADFGDGYSQRAVDGLNTARQEWQLQWTQLTKAQATQLKDFFIARGGAEAFNWTPPDEATARKWTSVGFDGPTPTTAARYSFSATLREEFDI